MAETDTQIGENFMQRLVHASDEDLEKLGHRHTSGTNNGNTASGGHGRIIKLQVVPLETSNERP